MSAFRNLPRVPTNGIRGGACLVIAEGLCQKSAKLRKIVEKLGVPGWEFLAELGHASTDERGRRPARRSTFGRRSGGRPVLAYPGRAGGFRLAYGRARTGGLASLSVNPATMVILRRFVAIGTQVKVEFPGKSVGDDACATPSRDRSSSCNDGTVTAIHDRDRAERLLPQVRRIVDLGEILVPFGEFLENNRAAHAPGAYTLDWHLAELEEAGTRAAAEAVAPTYDEAVDTSPGPRRPAPSSPPVVLARRHQRSRSPGSPCTSSARVGWDDGRLQLPWDAPEPGAPHAPRVPPRPDRPRNGSWETRDGSAALLGGLGLAVERGADRSGGSPLDAVGTDPLALVSRLAGVTGEGPGSDPGRGAGRAARRRPGNDR